MLAPWNLTLPWAFMADGAGGADNDSVEDDDDEDEESPDPKEGKDDLESVKAALQAERDGREKLERKFRRANKELSTLKNLKAPVVKDEEAERRAAERERQADLKIVRSEVIAAAAGKLANPRLAPRLLDLTEFEVDEDGDVDVASINAAIDRVIKENPYLRGGKADETSARKRTERTGGDFGGKGGETGKVGLNDAIRVLARP